MICVACNGGGKKAVGLGFWQTCPFCEGSGRASNPWENPALREASRRADEELRELQRRDGPTFMERHAPQYIPGKGEHILDSPWIVLNEDWPSGEGEYMVPCPGCEKCDPPE